MNWLLRTTAYRPDGIFSELYQGAALFCVTLEHAFESVDDKGPVPKLPRGATYPCRRGTGPAEGGLHVLKHYNKGLPFDTFEICEVPGHSGILFHPLNFNRESDGCVGTGREIQRDPADWWITHSQDTFAKLMSALEGVDEFELEVQ